MTLPRRPARRPRPVGRGWSARVDEARWALAKVPSRAAAQAIGLAPRQFHRAPSVPPLPSDGCSVPDLCHGWSVHVKFHLLARRPRSRCGRSMSAATNRRACSHVFRSGYSRLLCALQSRGDCVSASWGEELRHAARSRRNNSDAPARILASGQVWVSGATPLPSLQGLKGVRGPRLSAGRSFADNQAESRIGG